jgi:endonuclease YncB( thermonuclease family)
MFALLLRRPVGLGLLPLAVGLCVGALLLAPAKTPAGSPAAAAVSPSPAVADLPGPLRAHVLRVIDGDTFEARLRVWFRQDVIVLVRLRGIDAPELKGATDHERRLAREARDTLAAILGAGETTLSELGADKYNGRVVARASVADGRGGLEDVAAMMIAGGYGRAYAGGRRGEWRPQVEARAGAR